MTQYDFEGKKRTREEMLAIFKQDETLNRLQIVHRLISGKNNSLLDIGCGAGYTSQFYADKIGEFTGVDTIENNIAIAKAFFSAPNRKFITDNIFTTKKVPKGHFDYVLLLETIEHVDNPYDFINKSTEFLKVGGHVIISTPNAVSTMNILWNIKHRNRVIKGFDFSGTETDHIYTWDKQVLQNLLVKMGLKIIKVELSKATIRGGQSVIIKAQKVRK